MTQTSGAAALSPYRILDLTTERSWLTGKLLADLGATVTKVEPPGGDPGRLRGPYAGDTASAEASLQWWAYNRGKRSVTLAIDTADGRDLLLRLVARSDALLESFRPGQLEDYGLGYGVLAGVNPRLVLTRVTPFGQEGPYARFAANDLILSALGGAAWMTGDTDRAPVRISAPQYFLHAAAEAAAHTAAALYHAAVSGSGQQVDVSAQLATVRTLMNTVAHPTTDGQIPQRATFGNPSPGQPYRSLFRCSDGYVMAAVGWGPGLAGYLAWLRAEGVDLPGFLTDFGPDGPGRDPAADQPPDFPDRVSDVLAAFFAARGKHKLTEQALDYRLMLVPVNTMADVRSDPQLAARGYFRDVQHDGRGPVAYPSTWAHLSRTPIADTRRAPAVGEDNQAVWSGDLAISADELRGYQLAGTI
jgi:crotonobetainyl-CoA:carnitine CoA-transferase CaiB-like acyl-CoA transferase